MFLAVVMAGSAFRSIQTAQQEEQEEKREEKKKKEEKRRTEPETGYGGRSVQSAFPRRSAEGALFP